jgi:flagellar biogenesis protein FliO
VRLACASALIGALLGAAAEAQSTVAITGEASGALPATPTSASAAAGAAILEYHREDAVNNPLRTAADPAGYGAAIPAAAMEASPHEFSSQARAAAAFAPAEPPVSHDAPAMPLVAPEPIAAAPSPATASIANAPIASAPLPSLPLPTAPSPSASAMTAPPAAVAEDYDAAPTFRDEANEQGGVATREAAPPTFTLPASAAEAITPSADAGDAEARRLAPEAGADRGVSSYRSSAATRSTLVPTAFGQLKSLASAGGALAVVVALFVACALLLRRGGPKPTGALPPEAFAVLGRAPLTAQSFAQLLRLGNKLVLVAVTADGAQPLAEVDDPAEVDRIAGLCLSGHGAGPSAEFQQVLAQLAREPAKGFLGREGSSARRKA